MREQLGRWRTAIRVRKRKDVEVELLRHVERVTSSVRGPVVVLWGTNSKGLLSDWKTFGSRLHILAQPECTWEPRTRWQVVDGRRAIEDYLDQVGPVAAIVDEVAVRPGTQLERWAQFCFHLTPGGVFTLRSSASPIWWEREVEALADQLPDAVHRELRGATRSATLLKDHTVLTKQERHLLKVPETRADAVLAGREPRQRIRTLTSRPAQEVNSRVRVLEHGAESSRLPLATFPAPQLTCRWYRGPLQVRAGLVTVTENTVLPPSFRHAWAKNPRITGLSDLNRRFVAAPANEPVERLSGSFFDLNAFIPGHFGHVMTESIAKLWAWDEARAQVPGLRGFYRLPSGSENASFEVDLFGAFGLDPEDVHWATQDTELASYVSPTIPWHNGRPYHYHPAIGTVWSKLRSALVRIDPASPRWIFVSRSHTNRACRNQVEVESWFTEHGFDVVYPETLSIAQQATLFGNASIVAGFAGSAMFNILFAKQLERVMVLAHEEYLARNEWLFATALSEEVHYFWAPADLRRSEGRANRNEMFHSTWAFDLDRHESALVSALR